MNLHFLLLSLLGYSFSVCHPPEEKKWVSKYHPISLVYDAPWSQLPLSLDTREKLIAGFIEFENGTCLFFEAEPDVPRETVSDQRYGEALIEDITDSHEGNRFISTDSAFNYSGLVFQKYTFEIFSGRWGKRTQEFLIFRNGDWFLKVVRIFKDQSQPKAYLREIEAKLKIKYAQH